jgi:hypothetical protein
MTWPLDKLSLINEQLAMTGNNLVSVANDGSDEWAVTSAGYETGMEYMLDSHEWKQLTRVLTLQPTGQVPGDDQFDTVYNKPPDCIHVIWLRVSYAGGTGGSDFPLNYQIVGNQIYVNLFGGGTNTGTTTPTVTLKCVSSNIPNQNPASTGDLGPFMLRTFMTALRKFVEAAIYRGLNEDPAEARQSEGAARMLLQEARTRSDQEQPKRAIFNYRITASRRVRRPFPPTPSGWSGTGTPG